MKMFPCVHSRFFTALLITAALVFGLASNGFAQAGGSVTGTVKDPSGGVIPGATITLTNATLGNQFNAVSDGQGAYAFPNVPVGRYDLLVNLEGFKPLKRTGLAVDINSRSRAAGRHARSGRPE